MSLSVKKLNQKVEGGQNIFQYKVKAKKNSEGYNIDDIRKTVNKITKSLKKQKKNGKLALVAISKNKKNWVSAKTVNFNHQNFNANWLFSNNDEFYNLSREDIGTNTPSFRVYYIPQGGKKGGKDKFNNCLWKCLKQTSDKLKLSPSAFKRYLSLEKDEKVPLECLDKIENYLNICIDIYGDHTRISNKNFQRRISLNLKNEHYSLKSSKNTNSLLKSISKHERQLVIYKKETAKGKYTYWDGIHEFKDHGEFYKKNVYKPKTAKWLLVKRDDNLSLQETEIDYKKNADLLKKKSKGFINLYKGTPKNIALYLFHNITRDLQEPDIIEPYEEVFIKNSAMNALVIAPDNEIKLDKCYSYDVNSLYPYLLSKNVQFPTGKGILKTLNSLPKILSFGIYRVKVKSTINTKLFRLNKNDYYTNTDLRRARELGYELELIKDGEPNFLFYPPECRKSGSMMFKKFVDYLYEFKNKDKIPYAKKILNTLWGALCEKNRTTLFIHKDKEETINGDIETIRPQGKLFIYKTTIDKYFKNSYARIFPFIYAYARNHMSHEIEPFHEDVIRIHTDGFQTAKKINDIKLSNDIGKWKLEKDGCSVKIGNVPNKIIWFI